MASTNASLKALDLDRALQERTKREEAYLRWAGLLGGGLFLGGIAARVLVRNSDDDVALIATAVLVGAGVLAYITLRLLAWREHRRREALVREASETML